MIEFVQIDNVGSARDLAAKIRPVLARRGVVRIPGFSRNQNDIISLANQLGLATPGSVPQPEIDLGAAEHQIIAAHDPSLVMEFCSEPLSVARWFTDLTEVYKKFPAGLMDRYATAQATYSNGTKAPLIRQTRLGKFPYAAISDALVDLDTATPDEVADLIGHARNLYGHGTQDIYLDTQYDLLIHLTDGVALGRLPLTTSPVGMWLRYVIQPDWDLL